ncbi:MAG: hypothetical protein JNL50_02405 [Phycisphaerae bacterium]|nr:hypothetical protein [Phycisphaerae bacterium]
MRHTILALAILASLALPACSTHENDDGSEAACKEVKAGAVTTVNHYCVVMNDDPVDPELVREHKGQRVGFCCKGCFKKWDAMNDAQKDAAIAKAVALGKPAS